MSEKLHPKSPENGSAFGSREVREQIDKLGERLSEEAEKSKAERDPKKETKEARESVEKHAIAAAEHAPDTSEKQRQKSPVTRGHKKQTYRATMQRIEARLPSYQRVFSRVINNDAVDKVSAVAGRTVARPSGLLGSSLAAFIGLVAASYYANQLGFAVPPALFIVLLAGGWLAGLGIELIINMIKKAKR